MTLKELQEMIKEDMASYLQEDNIEEVDVDVDTGDVDADGATEGDDSEDILRNIYNMLKDKFEAEEGDDGDADLDEAKDDMDEDMMDEVKDDDKKDEVADMEEAASTGFGDPGAKNTSGKDAGYTPAKTTRGDGKLHEGKSQLQERFQKLANIIK